ncbi:hypothetical protein CLRAG_33380 [Clostridium ragsdalei P11]|uniref:Uncharacterized protein n=1 Tax=Clostridium ragsdalei P11 TaxID=1353534 RepID=A0A1A6AKT0_9CLOT|nr:hypothetical protein [Clostridium ragsdalei]OBR90690.1 hypothetical protein CLRAG_33380 [Clostridium ragsdalei P11]
MELKFNSLDDINNYYKTLNIKPYWVEESLGFNIIREIILIFNDLHNIYPDVVIKEIGDCYSYDKISNRICINNIKNVIDNDKLSDTYENDTDAKLKAKEYLLKQLSIYTNVRITKNLMKMETNIMIWDIVLYIMQISRV